MGIAVDIWGRDVLMTYVGEPAELNYTFDPTQAVATPGNQVAYGPLIYSEYQGWDTGIQVQNLSPAVGGEGEGVLPGPVGRRDHDAGGLDLPARAARRSSCRWCTTCRATGWAACGWRARSG